MKDIPLTPALNDRYDFIFGWSPGHSGTTILTSKVVYEDPRVKYFFEFKGSKLHYSQRALKTGPMTTAEWRANSAADDFRYVKRLVAFLNACRENNTVLDLGHENLYYARPLIRYLLEHTTYSFCFVRIVRDRFELALSLMFGRPHHRTLGFCDDNQWVQLCPLYRVHDVLVPIPSRFVWRHFTVMQQAFWIIDEVDKRWHQILDEFPDLQYMEIYWDKQSTVKYLSGALSASNQSVAQVETHSEAGNVTADSSVTVVGSKLTNRNTEVVDNSVFKDPNIDKSLYMAAKNVAELLCIRQESRDELDHYLRYSSSGNLSRFINMPNYHRCGKLAVNPIQFHYISEETQKVHAGNLTSTLFTSEKVATYVDSYREYQELMKFTVPLTHPIRQLSIGLQVCCLMMFVLLSISGDKMCMRLWRCLIRRYYHGKVT